MPQTEAKQVIRFGTFEVDPHTGELRKNGVHLKLQDQPFHVLLALLEKPGEIVTREELRARLWPADTFVDFDHGLNAAVKRLRDALGDTAENPRFIETLAKRGYRLLVPLNRQTDAPSPVGSPVESAGAVSQAKNPPPEPWGSSIADSPLIFWLATELPPSRELLSLYWQLQVWGWPPTGGLSTFP